MPELSRRALLRCGAAAAAGAGAYAFSALLGQGESIAAPPPQGAAPALQSGSFVSAARGGVETNWLIARPPTQDAALRPVIALHGRNGNAAKVMDLGVGDALAKLGAAGRRGIAVVSVDGGDSYWHRRTWGEDSGAMVIDELLPMLASQGFDTSRVAFLGWSMGGYGALLLGARLGPARTAGICAVSPALWTSGLFTDPGAFDGPLDWKNNTVFGLPALAQIPLRVDCGTGDRFAFATRRFIATHATPVAGGFSPGGHDDAFWRSHLFDELMWLAS